MTLQGENQLLDRFELTTPIAQAAKQLVTRDVQCEKFLFLRRDDPIVSIPSLPQIDTPDSQSSPRRQT